MTDPQRMKELKDNGVGAYATGIFECPDGKEVLFKLYQLENTDNIFFVKGDIMSISLWGKILFCKYPSKGLILDVLGTLKHLNQIYPRFILTFRSHYEAWLGCDFNPAGLPDLVEPTLNPPYPVPIACYEIRSS